MRRKWSFFLIQAKNKSNTIEDNFAALSNLISDLLVIVDDTRKLQVANLNIKKATCFDPKELVGKSIF